MANVLFFEKPGCAGNARQKALLIASGHVVEARSLLAEPWTQEELLKYLQGRPVGEWFNRSARRVKSGDVDPDSLMPSDALALLISDPLLIRRPLLQVGDRRSVGFDQDDIAAWIGLSLGAKPVTEACAHRHEVEARRACPEPADAAAKWEGAST